MSLLAAAMRPSPIFLMTLGTTTAASTARMTTTTRISISVKALRLFAARLVSAFARITWSVSFRVQLGPKQNDIASIGAEGAARSLLHQRIGLEDRQQDRQHDESHEPSHYYDDQRLDQ